MTARTHALEKEFWQIDVFTSVPLAGNPAAVVFDAGDLPTDKMQAIAREMNLSETVFMLPASNDAADYRARIFTPRSEIVFGGHPTIAAAYAFIERGGEPNAEGDCLRMECGLGLVRIELTHSTAGRLFTVEQASPRYEDVDLSAAECASLLGLPRSALGATPAQIVSTGVRWLLIPVGKVGDIPAIVPDQARIAALSERLATDGVIAFSARETDGKPQVRLRTFAPIQGIAEDPVCGSGNGAVGAYLLRHKVLGEHTQLKYQVEQGRELGRPGNVFVDVSESARGVIVKVGGHACTAARGHLIL